MRIVCPGCSATYQVPEGRLLPGRVVRCARCATDWEPVVEPALPATEPVVPEAPPAPALEPEQVAAVAPAPPAEPPVPVALADDRYSMSGGTKYLGALRAAWALSGVALVAAVWFAYSARDAVMQAWPPSVRAYAALGLVERH